MRKYLVIYEEALVIYDLVTTPFWISYSVYEENSVFFFISVPFYVLAPPLSYMNPHYRVPTVYIHA
jgi:hypothetical protein